MYLDKIVQAQNRGESKGITAICSAHPWVLKAAMQHHSGVLLIESTCNQVNQYGGYTGMTPAIFVDYVRGVAGENGFPFKNIILGGDGEMNLSARGFHRVLKLARTITDLAEALHAPR